MELWLDILYLDRDIWQKYWSWQLIHQELLQPHRRHPTSTLRASSFNRLFFYNCKVRGAEIAQFMNKLYNELEDTSMVLLYKVIIEQVHIFVDFGRLELGNYKTIIHCNIIKPHNSMISNDFYFRSEQGLFASSLEKNIIQPIF